jgi:L-lactate dehydrogenase (cytochrome)
MTVAIFQPGKLMHDRIPPPSSEAKSAIEARLALKRRYPTTADLRDAARRRIPNFAFEYADGGAGADGNIARNWSSFDGIELSPRCGLVTAPPPCDVSLFGRRYSAPVGIAPIGGPSVVLPGADIAFATAAQRARVPYVLGLVAGIDVERAAELAPDVLWFQLYRAYRNEHKIGLDLVDRAEKAGVHVLMLTVDTPVRTVRPREVKGGIVQPFRLNMRLRLDAMTSPSWMNALRRYGVPRFASFAKYLPPGAGIDNMAKFSATETGGTFTWDEIARYRDRWKKPFMLKGVLHPADVEKAIALGIDGVLVSNHGGRQIDALPAAIDVLPAIVEQARGRLKVFADSGVRSGTDIARAIALGAEAVFAGKAFLWSLGALGQVGPGHVIDLFTEDLRAVLGQLGCQNVAELRTVNVRHSTAYRLDDFRPRPPK